MPLDNLDEIKSLIETQGKAFDAFKAKLEGKADLEDVVTREAFDKIQKDLNDAVEAKAAIETAIEAERKEREALESKINKHGIQADSEAEAKLALELKDANVLYAANARKRGRNFTELSRDEYLGVKAAQNKYFRQGLDNMDQSEVKDMSVGSDPDGGFFVTPDMSGRIVRKIYESSPIRQVASVTSITSDSLKGVEDLNEAGAGYAGETSQGSDTTTPQIETWEIPVYWIDTEPKASQQLLDDAGVNVEEWLGNKVADKLGRFENNEFVTGAAAKIRGFTGYTTALDSGSGVTWGTIGHHVTGVNGDFAASDPITDLIDLVGLLKNEYLGNSVWMTRRSVITKMQNFLDADGRPLWQPSLQAGVPEQFMGYPIVRAEDMPALATGSLSLAFGDFREAYQVVDRQGIRVVRDALTSKPWVKFYTTKRTGGAVVNFEAIKLLKFTA